MTEIVIGIFVGGAGTRMGGVAKGLLRTPAGGETLIERLRRLCKQRVPEAPLVLVGRSSAYDSLGLSQLLDEPQRVGPIGGLRSLLVHAQAAGASRALALACDLPFIDGPMLDLLSAPLVGAARVPCAEGHLQPLAASYRPAPALAAVDRALAAGAHALLRVLDELAAELERIDVDAAQTRTLRDWDTPEDVVR